MGNDYGANDYMRMIKIDKRKQKKSEKIRRKEKERYERSYSYKEGIILEDREFVQFLKKLGILMMIIIIILAIYNFLF
ncbi:MAG: hypothetical protein AABX11_02820 [Nanoarchaeota archaeon]